VEIIVYQDQSDLLIDESSVEDVVREVLSFKKIIHGEIIFHFVTKEHITDLHGQFFQDPTPTDCITFPIDDIASEQSPILGEIFICPKVGMEYCKKNPYSEITLYVIHGILHLLGFDDLNEKDRLEMRKAENEVLTHLSKKNLVILSPNLVNK